MSATLAEVRKRLFDQVSSSSSLCEDVIRLIVVDYLVAVPIHLVWQKNLFWQKGSLLQKDSFVQNEAANVSIDGGTDIKYRHGRQIWAYFVGERSFRESLAFEWTIDFTVSRGDAVMNSVNMGIFQPIQNGENKMNQAMATSAIVLRHSQFGILPNSVYINQHSVLHEYENGARRIHSHIGTWQRLKCRIDPKENSLHFTIAVRPGFCRQPGQPRHISISTTHKIRGNILDYRPFVHIRAAQTEYEIYGDPNHSCVIRSKIIEQCKFISCSK